MQTVPWEDGRFAPTAEELLEAGGEAWGRPGQTRMAQLSLYSLTSRLQKGEIRNKLLLQTTHLVVLCYGRPSKWRHALSECPHGQAYTRDILEVAVVSIFRKVET